MREQLQVKGWDETEALREEQKRLCKRLIPRRIPDFGPVELLSYSTDSEQEWCEIAVMLRQGQQLGDHDGSRRQNGNPDAQDLMFTRGLEQPSSYWSATEPMEYVDQRGLLGIFGGATTIVEVGLEKPVLRRSINQQAGGSQAVGGQLNVGLSHDKIDIVARLRATVDPQGISPTQREGDAIGLEG